MKSIIYIFILSITKKYFIFGIGSQGYGMIITVDFSFPSFVNAIAQCPSTFQWYQLFFQRVAAHRTGKNLIQRSESLLNIVS